MPQGTTELLRVESLTYFVYAENGTIDLQEFEAALRAHGALRPFTTRPAGLRKIPVIPLNDAMFSAKKKNKKDAVDATQAASDNKPAVTHAQGLTQMMAGQLKALQQGVLKAQHMFSDLKNAEPQFEAIGENFVSALSRRQAGDAEALMQAGEKLASRVDTGIHDLTGHLDAMQNLTVELVHQLPNDYRIVWKQVRAPADDMHGCLYKCCFASVS
jgi:hypothetical protein